jgi:hypothetical protein
LDSGLTLDTTYNYNVLVRDGAGNETAYTMSSVKTVGDMGAYVAFYQFSGNANDSGPYGLNLTASTIPPTLTTNRAASANTAYHFDYNSQSYWRSSSTRFRFTTEVTMSYWAYNVNFYPYDVKHICRAGSNAGYCVGVAGDTSAALKVEFWAASSGYHMFQVSGYPQNVWTHIVVTCKAGSGGRIRAYLNGVLVHEEPWGGTDNIAVSANQLHIGKDSWSSDSATTGDLDDLRFYSKEIDANESLYLYRLPPD